MSYEERIKYASLLSEALYDQVPEIPAIEVEPIHESEVELVEIFERSEITCIL